MQNRNKTNWPKKYVSTEDDLSALFEKVTDTPLIQESKHADFQANFALAESKNKKENPRLLAEKAIKKIEDNDMASFEISGPGFINIYLKNEYLEKRLQDIQKEDYLLTSTPEITIIDYSSPNVAKPLHVGHLRSSVIGDALARILARQGNPVQRQNHLGDFGTHFGILLALADEEELPKNIEGLGAFYKKAKQKEEDPAFKEKAIEKLRLLQSGDEKEKERWQQICKVSQEHLLQVYKELDLTLKEADFNGESNYQDDLQPLLNKLKEENLIEEDDDALVAKIPGFKNKEGNALPLLVQKKDGNFLYATTDLAALQHRLNNLSGERLIYVTDHRQSQHFQMIFAFSEKAGWNEEANLEHVEFGTILDEEGRPFKTRSGDAYPLQKLLDDSQEKAEKLVQEKSPHLTKKEQKKLAKEIAVGALKYGDLQNARHKDYKFDLNKMVSFDGNTAPYLQYTTRRAYSVLEKVDAKEGEISIKEKEEHDLAKQILFFPEVIKKVGDSLQPHYLCTYLHELSSSYNSFYETCSVKNADQKTKSSRLSLCKLTAETLEEGLGLLGIRVPEEF